MITTKSHRGPRVTGRFLKSNKAITTRINWMITSGASNGMYWLILSTVISSVVYRVCVRYLPLQISYGRPAAVQR